MTQKPHKTRNALLAHLLRFRQTLLRDPLKFQAFKSMTAMGILAAPFILLDKPFMGVSLTLGALAGTLADNPDHPKGRVKTILLTVIVFGFASVFVELLYPFPYIFAGALVFFTVLFVLAGGMGERYRGVSFGGLLVAVYTMLGFEISPEPYYQPLLLTGGNLFYGLLSLIVLYTNPRRPLEEQLANGFRALSSYFQLKSRLFPSEAKDQEYLRNQLAMVNVRVIAALESSKATLNSFAGAGMPKEQIEPYLRRFMMLQELHERATSSHDRYEVLSNKPEQIELIEGLGQVTRQLGEACTKVADHLLTHLPYRFDKSLNWVISALWSHARSVEVNGNNTIDLLMSNIEQSLRALQELSDPNQTALLPRLHKDGRSIWERFKSQLSFTHPRMRYAIRLAGCMLIGYAIIQYFQLEKGEWVLLTSLFVCQPSYGETRRKLFERVLGTFTGVLIGIPLIQLLPTKGGEILLLIGCSYAFFYYNKLNYAISVIYVTIFVLAAFNLISGAGMALMWPRLMDTVIGAVLAIIMVRFLWPDWQAKKLPMLLSTALWNNTQYFKAIMKGYEEGKAEDDLDYRIARRAAHKADNSVVMAWGYMKVEPKKSRQFQERGFTMTYLNHALLSYLSALGAHRSHSDQFGDQVRQVARQALEQLQCAAQALKGERPGEEPISGTNLLEYIRALQQSAKGIMSQQLTLLYNIAEVTGQLMELANEVIGRGKKNVEKVR
jgi:uncharacterized membrane protein (TIGR01666 family)